MKNIERGKVILKSVATWVTLVVAILIKAQSELSKVAGAPSWLVHTVAFLITVLGGALVILTRVTPVGKDDRGILPKGQ